MGQHPTKWSLSVHQISAQSVQPFLITVSDTLQVFNCKLDPTEFCATLGNVETVNMDNMLNVIAVQNQSIAFFFFSAFVISLAIAD